MTTILGIKLTDRNENAKKLQGILTEYGCAIRTRIGLHNGNNECSSYGIILLELIQNYDSNNLEDALLEIDNLIINKMQL